MAVCRICDRVRADKSFQTDTGFAGAAELRRYAWYEEQTKEIANV